MENKCFLYCFLSAALGSSTSAWVWVDIYNPNMTFCGNGGSEPPCSDVASWIDGTAIDESEKQKKKIRT